MTQNVSETARKVQVWIFHRHSNEVDVLLLRTNAVRGNFWQSVTGKVEDGETFAEAAQREFFEETSISANSSVKPAHFSFKFVSRYGPVEEEVFFVECEKKNPVLDPGEHDQFEWVSVDEARKRVKFDSSREAIDRALEAMNS